MSSSQPSICMGFSLSGMVGVIPDHAEHLVSHGGHGGCVFRLDVEPQQRLGVGRPQVEPPITTIDGEAVETILFGGVVARYYVTLIKSTFLKDAGIVNDWPPLLGLTIFTVVLSTMAMRSFGKTLQ